MRGDGRAAHELRRVELQPDFIENPLASVLCRFGRTLVLCTVCEEPSVPRFLQGRGQGWISAEYAMLPGSTDTRSERESTRGRASGRSLEIQRLIGRSLRAIADLAALGERTLWIDCDVLQADGGTRCASITGGYVALALADQRLLARGAIARSALRDSVAAVSVGIVGGEILLDLPYSEDSRAEVDMNVVGTDAGTYVELQGTAEGRPFDRASALSMLDLADEGLATLFAAQAEVLATVRR